ncbi:MAG: DUF1318 domain-containing protein [Planctomycetes bacterium]|nr:DUF1318 domain-containing protein [Planctomycetota bacterium]
MIKRRLMLLPVLVLLTGVLASPASGQKDELARLRQSMKERYATLLKLHNDAKVGETWDGRVAAVKDAYLDDKVDPKDPKSLTVKQLLTAENSDRGRVYEIIAKDTNETPAIVALHNGKRAFANAAPNHWLKTEKAGWVQKKDIKTPKD